MAETALNFGPDCGYGTLFTVTHQTQRLRALAHGSGTSTSQPPSSAVTTAPKYSLAQYRYGREEMLALIPKDPKKPDCLLKDTSKIVKDSFALPLALIPHTEDEQRLWARSVNSDAVLRASGKSVPGNNMGRSGRGGSVDRGRGRGRGGYYQRGIIYEDNEDGPPSNFSRPKPIERSQSANEKDQRWDDKDRRFDRSYSGRSGGMDDSMIKDQSRTNEYWRKVDKDDEADWRSSNRSSDKLGPRGSWRNPSDKDRRDIERNTSRSLNGNSRNSSHPQQKNPGNNLPEWSVDESDEQDVVGTFDSSGAFLEPKMTDNSMDDIYVSDEADEGPLKDSPEAKRDVSKKASKSKHPPPQMNVSAKQCVKQTELKNKTDELMVEKHPPKISEPQTNSKTVTTAVTAENVIKTSVQHHYIVNNNQPVVNLPNVPDVKSTKNDKNSEASVPSAALEEDTFAHHKKATENMVAQWTEEEEQKVISQTAAPLQEKENRWYYQDPQGEIQGPFTSAEMIEWFTAGYFTMSLMVRRSCDEKFSQLGDLIKSWGRVPFMPGNSPPPIRTPPASLPNPVTQTIVPNPVAAAAPVTNQLPKQEDQLLALQQQLLQQQLMQQQLMLRQAQLQQLLAQLKQQDNFTSLNTQQQQQVLMQQFMAQQQMPRPNMTSEQPGLVETMTPLPLPLLGLPMAPLLKNDLSLWNVTSQSNPWPLNVNVSQPSGTSIWDVDPKANSEEAEIEKQKRLAKEQQEQLRKAEEERLAQEKEMEEKRKLEDLRRKEEEERHLKELQKQEEEKRKLEEQKRREEEKIRLEELRKIEEQKRKEEELKKQREEELRRIEEQKRLEELKRQEEQKRLEELRRKEEEERKQAELRKLEEQKKLEEKRKKEELQKKLEIEKEKERIEFEKQKEAARLKEIEREQQLLRERQKQKEKEEEMRRLAEIKLKAQGPAWGIQKTQSETQLSLVDIQRIQEEKEREEREERLRQQQMQQQVFKQVQQNKNSLSWAKRSVDLLPAVKSLAEIQQEEADRLVQQQRSQKSQAPAPVINSNVGVWGNASHLNRITAAPPSWNMNSVTTSGFWDDAVSSSQTKKQNSKTNDSAFPALINPEKPATTVVHSNKSKNVRAKKEEQDAVTKLYGNRKPTDEFTVWCTEALSAMPSSVDVPTFVAFLKDIESPYEVHDYVKSYLGDGKEPREFAKQFLDKRSKFRAKQVPAEENILWGPAPAINPVVNKSSISQPSNDNDGNSNAKGKSKRRKNRMQKLDSSMLGFTVQSNPDRLNVGEIDHVEGM